MDFVQLILKQRHQNTQVYAAWESALWKTAKS